jgi:hypothetical protein
MIMLKFNSIYCFLVACFCFYNTSSMIVGTSIIKIFDKFIQLNNNSEKKKKDIKDINVNETESEAIKIPAELGFFNALKLSSIGAANFFAFLNDKILFSSFIDDRFKKALFPIYEEVYLLRVNIFGKQNAIKSQNSQLLQNSQSFQEAQSFQESKYSSYFHQSQQKSDDSFVDEKGIAGEFLKNIDLIALGFKESMESIIREVVRNSLLSQNAINSVKNETKKSSKSMQDTMKKVKEVLNLCKATMFEFKKIANNYNNNIAPKTKKLGEELDAWSDISKNIAPKIKKLGEELDAWSDISKKIRKFVTGDFPLSDFLPWEKKEVGWQCRKWRTALWGTLFFMFRGKIFSIFKKKNISKN